MPISLSGTHCMTDEHRALQCAVQLVGAETAEKHALPSYRTLASMTPEYSALANRAIISKTEWRKKQLEYSSKSSAQLRQHSCYKVHSSCSEALALTQLQALSYRIIVRIMLLPAASDAAPLPPVFGPGNTLQKRSVSSPAPVTMVWPSGATARYSTLHKATKAMRGRHTPASVQLYNTMMTSSSAMAMYWCSSVAEFRYWQSCYTDRASAKSPYVLEHTQDKQATIQ
jgi:hypothetical protein